MGPKDAFNSLFYAQDQNGNQVAYSAKSFFGSTGLQTPDAQAALDDLVAKLRSLGWQQIVGTIPDPWYSLTFQLVVYTSNCIVKPLQQDAFNNLFCAEDQNGNQIARSDQTFSGDPGFETSTAIVALNDLIAKLQALGLQQITVGIPTPWYSFEFKKMAP